MKKILITGATGNIGIEVIRFLFETGTQNTIIAGVRNVEKAKAIFKKYPKITYAVFDFENPKTFDGALNGIDSVFLLRPPHISDTDKYFKPLISRIKEKGIKETIFLSVQGAEKSRIIPHNKIETLILESGPDFIFLRPGYFMQNLTTTLLDDIQKKRQIILPAGKAKFNWIDAENIGETAARLLDNFEPYKNRAIELTGYENENFQTVTDLINSVIKNRIEYQRVNPFRFYSIKKRDGMEKGMIIVMAMLHFLPRFQKEPLISKFYEEITGKKPTTLKEFITRNKELLQ